MPYPTPKGYNTPRTPVAYPWKGGSKGGIPTSGYTKTVGYGF